MSSTPITAELREFADEIDERAGYGVVMPNPTSKHSGAPYGPSSETEELYAIADRIDAEHERRMDDCRREVRREVIRYMRGVLTDLDRGVRRVRKGDKVEVVRCRDCLFAHPRVDGLMQCDITRLVNHENFFCANGARREMDA